MGKKPPNRFVKSVICAVLTFLIIVFLNPLLLDKGIELTKEVILLAIPFAILAGIINYSILYLINYKSKNQLN